MNSVRDVFQRTCAASRGGGGGSSGAMTATRPPPAEAPPHLDRAHIGLSRHHSARHRLRSPSCSASPSHFVRSAQRLYGYLIPWPISTSDLTKEAVTATDLHAALTQCHPHTTAATVPNHYSSGSTAHCGRPLLPVGGVCRAEPSVLVRPLLRPRPGLG